MDGILQVLQHFLDIKFVLLVFAGALAGLFVGAIPGLSVTMATALLLSLTYSWQAGDALAAIMGVYVVGVFSGAISAILIRIPGAPSSLVTMLDGSPMAQKGRARQAISYAAWYSFFGTLFGMLALWLLAKPMSGLALSFQAMDYVLLSLFGLSMVGGLSGKSIKKGLVSVCLGLILSMVGMDSVYGTPRLTFGIEALNGGIGIVPALIGLFGFSEILFSLSGENSETKSVHSGEKAKISEIIRHFPRSVYYGIIGILVGALPGAGAPIASFLAYGSAKRLVKSPKIPFGEGTAEGIVASETANNACIGGALIPMLFLAVPGDAVTAVLLSVFRIHNLNPGPSFLKLHASAFSLIIAAGLLASVFLLLFGLFLAPKMARVLRVPKRILLPLVAILSLLGAFSASSRMFDVFIMLCFGFMGFVMRKHDYPLAPMILALVLGGLMDANFRRALQLAMASEHFLHALFIRPITLVLLVFLIFSIVRNVKSGRQQAK